MNRNLPLMLLFFLFVSAPLYAADMVPPFTFTDLAGNTYSSDNLKGAPLVINVGAHWWPKCTKEAPELQRAYLKYKDKGVVFLGLFASKDKEIKAFSDKFHLTYPMGKESGIATILWVKAIPETLFINKEGRIVKRYSGTINYEELTAAIDELLE